MHPTVHIAQIAVNTSLIAAGISVVGAIVSALITGDYLKKVNHKLMRNELFKLMFPEKVEATKILFASSRTIHEDFYKIARTDNDHRSWREEDDLALKSFKEALIANSCWFDDRVESLGQEYIRACEGLLEYEGKPKPTVEELEKLYRSLRKLLRDEIQIQELEIEAGKSKMQPNLLYFFR